MGILIETQHIYTTNMKVFVLALVALFAVAAASPVQVEERDIISMVIEMLKGFICSMQEERIEERGIMDMIINMVKTFLCNDPNPNPDPDPGPMPDPDPMPVPDF